MEKVLEILKKLELENEIDIIYAVEAGSRAWGLESDDSDYDIRFIFVYKNTKKYLSLKPFKETIDGFSDDRLYDWQGWDITKSLKLLSQMNPSLIEWIYSPIVYYKDESRQNFLDDLKQLLISQKSILPLLHHYRSMAKSNYITHIKNEGMVKIKKYLYVIRPAGMFEWLLKCNKSQDKLIEIDFNKVLEDLKAHLSTECYEKILSVIETKKQVKELDLNPRLKCIDDWIENILNNTNGVLNSMATKKDNTNQDIEEYDKILHKTLQIKI